MLLPRYLSLRRRPTPRGIAGHHWVVRRWYCLLRVELDDELLLDGHGDVVARRGRLDGAAEAALVQVEPGGNAAAVHRLQRLVDAHDLARLLLDRHHVAHLHLEAGDVDLARSEEHTSELQSQFHLVCRLLLEKKKRTDGPLSRP